MDTNWQKKAVCAIACSQCDKKLDADDQRILSVYDHQPICLDCKRREELRPDYSEVSKEMIGGCMQESEATYGDMGEYCYFHFYPLKC